MSTENEKHYRVYFSDYPYDPLTCTASSVVVARLIGQRYAKKWHLAATVVRIEEFDPDNEEVRA